MRPGGEARGGGDSALLLASGAVRRRELPDVPRGDRPEEAGRQRGDAAEADPRLPDAGDRRHGDRLRQREGEGGPEGDARIPAARIIRSIARPATRRASAFCRTTATATVVATAGCRSRRSISRTRTTSAIRSRCSPIAASCAAAACGSRARSAARPSCRSSTAATHCGDRYLSGRAVQQQAGRQRGRSVPGRRVVQQGFSVQAAGVVAEDGRKRVPELQHGLQHPVDQNEDRVYRLRPRANPLAQGHFMCDEGRFGWKYIHSDQRLTLPEQRSDGKVVSHDWDVVLPAARAALVEAGRRGEGAIAAVLSPWMTLEEAYLLASYLKSLAPKVALAMGPVRTVGDDDKYPKDVHGRPMRAGEVHDSRREVPESARRGNDSATLRRRRDADGRRVGPGQRRQFRRDLLRRRRSAQVGSTNRRRRRSTMWRPSSCKIFCRRRPAAGRRSCWRADRSPSATAHL